MIFWGFAIITLGAVLTAAFALSLRNAILALWIAGFGSGGMYLTIGVETLAIIQWIVSTLVAIAFVFFAVMFGEFGKENINFNPARRSVRAPDSLLARASLRTTALFARKSLLVMLASLAIGLGFGAVIWYGSRGLLQEIPTIPTDGNDLASLGQRLTQEHFLSLEILALTLFLVIVGGGVVARPDSEGEPDAGTSGATNPERGEP